MVLLHGTVTSASQSHSDELQICSTYLWPTTALCCCLNERQKMDVNNIKFVAQHFVQIGTAASGLSNSGARMRCLICIQMLVHLVHQLVL